MMLRNGKNLLSGKAEKLDSTLRTFATRSHSTGRRSKSLIHVPWESLDQTDEGKWTNFWHITLIICYWLELLVYMDDSVRTLIGHEVIIIWKEQGEIKMRQFDPNPKWSATCSRIAIIRRQQLAGSKDIKVISGKVHIDKCVSRSLQFICVLDGAQDPKSCKESKMLLALFLLLEFDHGSVWRLIDWPYSRTSILCTEPGLKKFPMFGLLRSFDLR